jgi:deoxyribonucleoside regulator
MVDIKKIDLLVSISRLYYENNYSQQMIAEKTGLSRPYVSKLIAEARECGIVEIKINDPNEAETQMELEIKEKFNLQKVIIIPSPNDSGEKLLERLSIAASRYLNTIVKDNDIIGVSWGATLYTCSKIFKPVDEFKNITIVQLCGALSMLEKNIYASEIPVNFAAAFKGMPYMLPLPAVVDNLQVKNAIVSDKNISNILEIGKKSNIVVFSVGPFGHNSTLPRAGYLTSEEVTEMVNKGAVGDFFSRIINIKGEICDKELNDRTIGIDLDEVVKKDYRILIAGGTNKAKCIYGTISGGYPNILITDENTAMEILKIYQIYH